MLYFLVGFMGAGKTTVGKLLAEKLTIPFIDSDQEIEKQQGISVKKIFELQGESHFRRLEKDFIENLSVTNAVVSCGGGLPCFNSQMDRLLRKGTVIYLKAEVETLSNRLKNESAKRPLLEVENLEKSIEKRLTEREPDYTRASKIINTDMLLPGEVVGEILRS